MRAAAFVVVLLASAPVFAQVMTLPQLQAYTGKLAARVIAADAKIAAQAAEIEQLKLEQAKDAAALASAYQWTSAMHVFIKDWACKWNLLQSDLSVRLTPSGDPPGLPAGLEPFAPRHVACDGTSDAPKLPQEGPAAR